MKYITKRAISLLFLMITFQFSIAQSRTAIIIETDTIGALSKYGKGLSFSIGASISFVKSEHLDEDELVKFCKSELMYLIREETAKLTKIEINGGSIEANIKSDLDSIYDLNKIRLIYFNVKDLK